MIILTNNKGQVIGELLDDFVNPKEIGVYHVADNVAASGGCLLGWELPSGMPKKDLKQHSNDGVRLNVDKLPYAIKDIVRLVK